MTKILEGIRAIEWAWMVAGPTAGYVLGDLGADVIKIEEPGSGDPGRWVDRYMGVPVSLPNDSSPHFELANRNKRSVTLNLRHPEGREVLYRLVEKSDIFYNNFRKSVRERLGLDYGTLRDLNPRLIYATTTGFGPEGPAAESRAYDNLGMARAGTMYTIGEEGTPPQQMVFGLADQMTGTFLAFGIISALLARERHDVGQEVDASLFGTMLHGQGIANSVYFFLGEEAPRPKRRNAFNPLVVHYECKDGRWVAFSEQRPQEAWPRFCAALSIESIQDDPRFTTTKARGENSEELIAIIEQAIGSRPFSEWEPILTQYDLIFAPVQRIQDVASDEQAWANRYLVKHDHSVFGPTTMLGFPIGFSEMPASIEREAPRIGQHTEEVLMEVGEYTWDDITRMRDNGII